MDLTTEQMLARISDDELQAAAIARDLCVSKSKHETLKHRLWSLEGELDGSVDAGGWPVAEVKRLLEHIALGETDEALTLLRDLAPDTVPPPAAVKRLLADRRADAAGRAA